MGIGRGDPHVGGQRGRRETNGGRSGRLAALRTLLRPHSHDLADQIDSAIQASAAGIAVTKLTLAILLGTAALQLVIALVSDSVSLLADTVHNVADALTSVPLWIAFVVGRRARTRRFPYGFRRTEDLAGIAIVAVIAVSVVVIAWESVARLLDPKPLEHLPWVLLAGVLGVAGNEAAAAARIRVGRRIGSAALVADGYHARADMLASLAVVLAVIGTWLGYPVVDAIVGLVIAGLILWILRATAARVLQRLMDGIDPDALDLVEDTAAAVDGVQAVTRARARWSGHRLEADLAVTVDRDLTVAQGHDVAEHVRHALLHRVPRLGDVHVHVDPCDHAGGDAHAQTAHHDS